MYVHESASTAELARLQNILETSGTSIVKLETEVADCHKHFRDQFPSKITLDDKLGASGTRLRDFLDIVIVHGAHLRSIEVEEK